MLAAAGGGGGTDWSSMTVPQMQALIQNPDTDQYYGLLTGWQRSYELLGEHMSQVQNYRDNLAAAWPPKTNKAAEAYLDQLNLMLGNLKQTYEAAIANHDAFASATLSLGLAQPRMQKIFDEYQTNDQLLLNYTNTQEQKQSSSTPTPTPSPSPGGDEPPVAPGRQEQLHQQAITLMSSVSSDLVQNQVKIVTPAAYQSGIGIGDKTTPNNGTTYTPPPIPPITPVPVTSGGAASTTTRPSTTFPSNTSTTQPGIISPSTNQPGLVLGGTTTPVNTSPPRGLGPVPSTLPTNTGGPLSNPGLPTGTNPFVPNGESLPRTSSGVNRGLALPNEGVLRSGGGVPEGIRAMPPGGMIGGAPGAGLGQPGATRPGARRVNPVGGVIGEGEPGARSGGLRGGAGGVGGYGAEGMIGGGGRTGATSGRGTGAGGRSISASERAGGPGSRGMSASERASGGARGGFSEQSFGQATGRRGGRRGDSECSNWDPDNPWETEQGVAPVVLPPREQRVDPGPAIGLN